MYYGTEYFGIVLMKLIFQVMCRPKLKTYVNTGRVKWLWILMEVAYLNIKNVVFAYSVAIGKIWCHLILFAI